MYIFFFFWFLWIREFKQKSPLVSCQNACVPLLSLMDSRQFILCEFRFLFSSEAWWTEVAKKIGFDIQIKLERLVFWRSRYHTAYERDLMELRASPLQPFHQEETGLVIRHWHAAHLAANELSRWKLVETQDLTQNLAWLNCFFFF